MCHSQFCAVIESTSGVADAIEVWGEISNVLEPTVHYWYVSSEDVPRRVCDGVPQIPGPVPASGSFETCRVCADLFAHDSTLGTHRFELVKDPPLRHRRPLATLLGSLREADGKISLLQPRISGIESEIATMAINITLNSFLTYVTTPPRGQMRMVRTFLEGEDDPSAIAKRDNYREFREIISKTHRKTRDLESVRNFDRRFRTKSPNKRKNLNLQLDLYLDLWDRVGKRYFTVPSERVELEDLSILINANLGMETIHGDKYALKWWPYVSPPAKTYRRFFALLTDMLRPMLWERDWTPAIWDMRRHAILPRLEPEQDDLLFLQQAASSYVYYQKRLRN